MGGDEAHSSGDLFDNWASRYDQDVRANDAAGQFPFAGYERVLNTIVELSKSSSGVRILDIGCGTGNLSGKFVTLGCNVTGLDFSEQMLEIAFKRYPQAAFHHSDLLGAWHNMQERRFDRVVSAYTFHGFPLPEKLRLIQKIAARYLAPSGEIIIGDISFETTGDRDQAHQNWLNMWDEDEYYWSADETKDALRDTQLSMTYQQISHCAGVYHLKRTKDAGA